MLENRKYNAVIIGAGVGGLVCGCYLAQKGLKTLIIERNHRVGGCCFSFVSHGFKFDACAHALSSLRENGMLFKVMKELGIYDRLETVRPEPSEVIISPYHRIALSHRFEDTLKSFQDNFSSESDRLEKFLRFIVYSKFSDVLQLKNKSFREFLDANFSDEWLKTILGTVVYLLVGVNAVEVSAVIACLLLREFMFDGGYYPKGGMQAFVDLLLNRFRELQGEILLSKCVDKIIICNNEARGVIVDGKSILANNVISACDGRQTFLKLVGDNNLEPDFYQQIIAMKLSSSVFLTYMGLSKPLPGLETLRSNVYVVNESDEKRLYQKVVDEKNAHFAITSSSMRDMDMSSNPSLCIATNAIYHHEGYWNAKKRLEFSEHLKKSASKIISGLAENVVFEGMATPVTTYHWTLNTQGAAYGWASTVEQFGDPANSQKTKIKNLYVTGHWSNLSSGISLVANCAALTSGMIDQ